MSLDLEKLLNPRQLEAVMHGAGPLMVIAGAGSGKTRVIVYRIARLIAEGAAAAGSVLAVTFTNKAAGEMKSRIEAMVGERAKACALGTFHSVCARILRRHAALAGRTSDFLIYDEQDSLSLMKSCIEEMKAGDLVEAKGACSILDGLKNNAEGPEGFTVREFDTRGKAVRDVLELYERRIEKANAFDFGDLILQTCRVFQKNDSLRRFYRDKWSHILVDEFQDTNRAQYTWLQLLRGNEDNVCVVGDDDQSIYSWRGADIRNILSFEKDFPSVKIVTLDQNYRSTKAILRAADFVIRQNPQRRPKTLWSDREEGRKVTLYCGSDEHDEAKFVIREIQDLRASESLRYGDFAIFYRTHAQSRVIEEELRRGEIGYIIVGGIRFYDRAEIKDALAYLKVIHNPSSDVDVERIINTPARGIGAATIEKLKEAQRAGGLSMWAAIESILASGALPSAAASRLKSFRDLVTELREGAESLPVSTVLSDALRKSGYLVKLKKDGSEEALSRMENIEELLTAAGEFEEENPGAVLGDYLSSTALVQNVDGYRESKSAVNMMTLHSAKGLEFPVVFLAGLEESLLPHFRSLSDENAMSEERRLCYVGMTRAKEKLYLARASSRRIFNSFHSNEASRFLKAVPLSELRLLGAAAGGYGSERLVRAPASRRVALFSEEPRDQSSLRTRFRKGSIVLHNLFGEGEVRACEETGGKEYVTVFFPSAGLKTIMSSFLKER